ncbi:MAG: hypothetical protein V7K68_14155 [Nostoc sp.]|uniref:hypothetical protein n=1 Tax=Nostoc sp. TaxID=1180 RepID=UPI002FFCB184
MYNNKLAITRYIILLTRKSKYSLLFLALLCFCISLLLALIHSTFNINLVSTIVGLTLFFSGFSLDIFLHLKNQNRLKRQVRLVQVKQTIPTSNHQTIIDTRGGNLKQNIAGNLVGRDVNSHNIKNITVRDREVEINPNNIIETFEQFRDILVQSITQSSDALESISEFAKELTEELRNRPEVKVCFGVDENISTQELINEIFIDLLTKAYKQNSDNNPNNLIIQPDKIEEINTYNGSEFIESFRYSGNNEYDVIYQAYTIHLFQEEFKWWRYKIRRSDVSYLERANRQRSGNIYFAIGKAIIEIEKELTNIWANNPE